MNDNQNNGIVIQKKHIIIAVLLILLLLVGGIVIGVKLFSKEGQTNNSAIAVAETEPATEAPTAPNIGIDIDPNAGKYTGEEAPKRDEEKEAAGIKIPGYPSITIAKDTENVRMALQNPEDNPCYFKFQIVLKDTGETIFESKYVPPGDAITDVTLAHPLAEGEYNATIMITTIALDQQTPLNGANVETVLIAK